MADLQTQVQQLEKGGFSQVEINNWKQEKVEQLTQGGFTGEEIAKDFGFVLKVTGVPAMPYFRIEHEDNDLHIRWTDECLARGLYLTSYHNHFLSVAHGESEISQVVKIASNAFESISRL